MQSQNKFNFIVFCLESYRQNYKLSGSEAFKLFKERGVFGFVDENYEVLHTQSKLYILEEIESFLKNNEFVSR